MVVPVMAGAYFLVTLFVIIKNITLLPSVIGNIFSQAFGIRQFAGGGLGVIVMNGVKRGLFSKKQVVALLHVMQQQQKSAIR